MEPLEERRLLAIDVTLTAAGVLTIQDTEVGGEINALAVGLSSANAGWFRVQDAAGVNVSSSDVYYEVGTGYAEFNITSHPLTSISIDTAAENDNVTVLSIPATVTAATVSTGAGDDSVAVGGFRAGFDSSNVDLDAIAPVLSITTGDGANDTITLDDKSGANSNGVSYVVTNSTVARAASGGIFSMTYDAGTERLNLLVDDAANVPGYTTTVAVESTNAGTLTTIAGGGRNEIFNLTNLGSLAGPLALEGGSLGGDVDAVRLQDGANTTGREFTLLPGSIAFTGGGLSPVSFSGLESVGIIAGAGSDRLTVDLSGGATAPSGGVEFTGGEAAGDNDRVEVIGYNAAGVEVSHSGPEAGSVKIGAGAAINFAQSERLSLGGAAASLTLNLPNAAAQATLEDDAAAAAGVSQLTSNNGTFTTTTFANPTASLTVNAQGLADTLTLKAMDPAYAANTLLNSGGGDDTVNILATPAGAQTSLNLGAGVDTAVFGATLATAGTGAGTLAGILGPITAPVAAAENIIIDNSADTVNRVWTADSPGAGLGRVSVAGLAAAIAYNTAAPANLVIHAGGGDDQLVVDFSGGNASDPMPASGLTFNGRGASSGDSMVLQGGAFNTVTHTFANEHDGTVAISGAGVISYTGLEPITDNLDVTNRVFTFTSPITDGILQTSPVSPATHTRIDSAAGELVDFTTPSASLAVNLADGTNTFTVASLAENYLTPANTITGGSGADTVNIERTRGLLAGATTWTLDLAAGNDTVNLSPSAKDLDNLPGAIVVNGAADADTLNLFDDNHATGETYTVASSTVTRAGFGGVTYDAALEVLNLVTTGSGNDTINVTSTSGTAVTTINTGAGSDIINLSPVAKNLGDLSGPLVVGGGDGSDDALNLFDDRPDNDTYTITGSTVTRTRAGFGGVTYDAAIEKLNLVTTGDGTDTVNVTGTSATATTTINTAGGNDIVNLSPVAKNLGDLSGSVVVSGAGDAEDQLNLFDDRPDNDTYTVTASTIARVRAGFGGVTYDGAIEKLNLVTTGAGDDTVDVLSTSATATTTIDTAAGNDIVNLSPVAKNLGNLPGAVVVKGGDGDNDALNLFDDNRGDGDTYTVTSSTVVRAGFGGVTYDAAVEKLNLVNTGGGADIINVTSTSATATTTIDTAAGNDIYNISASALGGANRFAGGDGNDKFNVNITTAAGISAPLNLSGGASDFGAGLGGRDEVEINELAGPGAVALTLTYTGGSGLTAAGLGQLLTIDTIETLDYNGAGGDDRVTVVGTSANDLLTAAPVATNRAIVFSGGQPFDAPPQAWADRLPGVAGGSLAPDLDLDGLETLAGLTIRDGGGAADRLYVYGQSAAGLSDGNAFDPFGFGPGLILDAVGAPAAYDVVSVSDTQTAIDDLVRVNYNNTDFQQAGTAVVVNTGFEPNNPVADAVTLNLSTAYRFQINGGDPDPATTGIIPPAGDHLIVPIPLNAEVDIYSDKADPTNVTIKVGGDLLPFHYSSIEGLWLIGATTVNLIGDNNNTTPQNDNFVVVGADIDGDPSDGGYREAAIRVNGSGLIFVDGLQYLNVFGHQEVDTLEISPYADDTPRGWGVDVYYDEGAPVGTDGDQADLLIYNTSLNGGNVSENIVVQPSGPEGGELRATNATDGSAIVTINYVANLDIVVNDGDGGLNDTDTLTLRGMNPDGSGGSGNETVHVNFGAVGDAANPQVTVADGATMLYRLRTTNETFSTVVFEMLGGTDVIHVDPSSDPAVAVVVDGGAPLGAIPGAGDTLNVVTGGDNYFLQPGPAADSGTVLVAGASPVTFTNIENLQVNGAAAVLLDKLEPNDTIAAATNLGSEPAIALKGLTLHQTLAGIDQDYLAVTAHDTGLLIVKARFSHAQSNLNLELLDAAGTVLGSSASTADVEQVVIPVVAQQTYLVHVLTASDAPAAYDLEIENFAAPVPNAVKLNDADDSGSSSLDNVTSVVDGQLIIEADLGGFASAGISILTAAQAAAGNVPGAAVEVFVDGVSVGFAEPNALAPADIFNYTFGAGELSQGAHLVKAAVRIVDGQATNQSGRTLLSAPLSLVIDTTAPAAPTLDLASTSDTNLPGDYVTAINQPAFVGAGEANGIVYVFADGVLVGRGIVNSAGAWEVTVEPLADGVHAITAQVEDLAGNLSAASNSLLVTIDTALPQVPTIDLLAAYDTGSSDLDNVTIGSAAGVVMFRITADPGTSVVLKDGNTVITEPLLAPASGELVVTIDFNALAADGGFPVEGPHPVSVESTDVAGNTRQSAQLLVTIDLTPPPDPTIALAPSSDTGLPGDGLTNIAEPAFFGLAEANAKVRVYANNVLVGQGVVHSDESDGDNANGLGVWEVTVEPLANGDYTIEVEVEDLAGHVSQRAALGAALTIDGTYPQRPTMDLVAAHDSGASDLDNVTRQNTVDFIVTSEAGTTVVIKDGNTVIDAFPSTGTNTRTLSLTPGTHLLSAESTDAAGNISHQSEELVVTIDLTPPAAPAAAILLESSDTGTLGDGVTSIRQPAFSGVAEANALVGVVATNIATGVSQLVGQGRVNSDLSNGVIGDGLGLWEVTVEPLADGEYAMSVVLEDLAGNLTVSSALLTITIDTLSPQRPTIDLLAANDSGASDRDNVTSQANDVPLTITAEPDSRVLVKDGEAVIDDFIMPAASTVWSHALGDGEYQLSVESFDAAGNRSAQSEVLSLVIDRQAPAAPTAVDLLQSSDTFDNVAGLSGPQGTNLDDITSLSQPALFGLAEANARIRVYANGLLVGQGVVGSDESDASLGGAIDDNTGIWEITTEPLADGVYAITVELEDLAGNTTLSQTLLTITIDTLSPQRPTIDLLAADDTGASKLDNVTNRANDVPLTITAEPGSRVLVKNGETIIDDFVMLAASTVRPYTLLDGEYQLSAESFDAAGNRSAQSEVLSLVIDRTAPAATTPELAAYSDTGTPGDAVTSIAQPAFVGTAEANAKVRVYANGVLVGETFANSDESDGDATDGLGLWEVTVEPLADGTYEITTEVEDLAGNISAPLETPLVITIDSGGPQRPTIDLLGEDDTGASELDNVTIGDPDVLPLTQVADFRISAEPGSTVVIKDGQTVIDTFEFDAAFDLTDGVADGFGIVRIDFAANQLDFNIPAEGPHPLSAEALDGAGNFTQSEQLLVTIDTTAPAATVPALAGPSDSGTIGDGITSVTQPAFVGTAEANAKVRIYANGILVGEGVVNSDESDGIPTNGLGLWEITVEPLADGVYQITTEVEDLAGNVSAPLEAPLVITIDTVSPQRPTIDLVTPHDTGASNLDNVTRQANPVQFTITADIGTTVHVKDGNTIVDTFISTGADIRVLDLAEGTHLVSAESIDAAGNISHQSEELVVTIDRTAPDSTVPGLAATSDTGLAGDRITSIAQPAFVGVAEANAKVRVFADGVLVGEGFVNSDESFGEPGDGLGLWEITVEPLADGVYQITTEVEDLAGNISEPLEAPLEITIDTVSPQRPTMDLAAADDTGASNLDNVTRLASVSFTVTADVGTTVHVKDGNTIVDTFVSTGADTRVLTLAEGTHLVSAESIDAAGNISHQSEELVVTIDLTAPDSTVPGLAATSDTGVAGDQLTSISQPAFVGVAEANAKVRVFAKKGSDAPVLVGETFANSDESDGQLGDGLGLWEITVEPLADGVYQITTEVEDLAGNISAPLETPLVITIDTISPQRPTMDLVTAHDTGASNLDNVTRQPNQVAFTVTADVGTTVHIKDGNTIVDTFISGGADTRLLTLAEGTHLVSAESIDAAGNISHQSEELVVTVDRTAPATTAPGLAATSDTGLAGDRITSIAQPAFVGRAEANAKVRVYAGGVLVGEGLAGSDESDGQVGDGLGRWEITVEPLADGVYQITTEVEDLAGNVSAPLETPLVITIDTLSPQRPTIDLLGVDDTGASELDDVTNRANDVPLTITAEPGSRVVVKNGETVIDDFIMPAASTVRNYALGDGEYKLSVESFDAAGNRSAQSEVLSLVIDRTAPSATTPALAPYSDTGAPGDAITSIAQPAFVGRAEANAKVRVFAGGVLVGETFANSDESDGDATDGLGLWEVTVEPLADGVYQITTEVEDLAGNISAPLQTPLVITIDSGGPQRPTIDLLGEDDTGASELDNVTIGDPDVLPQTRVADFRISAEPGSTVVIKDGQTVIDTFEFDAAFDLTDGVVDGFGIRRIDFVANETVFGIPAEGPHPLSAEATDDAGNFTQSEELLLTIDTTAPAATVPALAATSDTGLAGDHLTSITQPAFRGTAEANAKVRIFAKKGNDAPVLVGETFANSDESDGLPSNGLGLWEITVEPLADGVYQITTEVEDLAGNVSAPLEVPLVITIDTISPQRPTIDLVTPHDTGASNLDNVTRQANPVQFTVTADVGTTVHVKDGNTILVTYVSTGVDSVSLTLAEGTHLVSAESIDAAGNISHQSEELVVTIDRTAPGATVPGLAATSDTGLAGDRITSISDPAFVGRAEANAKVRVYAGGVLVGEGLAGSDESDGQLGDGLGLWEITVEPLADGVYQITTVVEDLAGNISAPLETPLVITIDTVSPQRPTMDLVTPHDTGASNLDNVTRQANQVDFTVTADAGTTVHVKDGNTILVTYVSTGVDTVSLTLAEGTHLVSAESVDAAGNISHQSEELVVTIDRTAPDSTAPGLAATSDTGLAGDQLTSINQPAFVGRAEASAKVRVFAGGVLVGEGLAGSDESDGQLGDGLGLWEITVEPLADGVYQITTEVEDLAGNISAPLEAPLVITIDTISPQRPTMDLVTPHDTGASNLDNVTRQANQVDFTVTADIGTTVHVKDGNTILVTYVSTGVDTVSLTLAEGTHLVSAESIDAAGNISHQSEELVVTIDRTAPPATAPALAATSDTGLAGDHLTSITQPAFVGRAEANAKVRVFADGVLVGEGLVGSDESDGQLGDGLGLWEITVEPLADGVYQITTEVEDLAGNVSAPLETPLVITIDTISPQRPTMDLVTPHDTGASNLDNVTRQANQVDFTVTADIGTTVHVKDGNTILVTYTSTGVDTVSLTLAEGTHLLSAESIDAAGNISHQSEELVVTIDRTAPDSTAPGLAATSDTGLAGDQLTSINQPAFVGRAEANAKVRVFAGGVLVGEGLAGSDESDGQLGDGLGLWEITVEPLADGVYQITTEVEDLAGNISAPLEVPLVITIDTVSPQRPTMDLVTPHDTGASNLDNVTRQADPVDFTVTADAGTTVHVKDGNTILVTYVSTGVDTISLVLAEGTHLVSAESIDAAGNISHQSEELVVTIDRTAPAATVPGLAATSDTGLAGDHVTSINQPAFVGRAEANAKVRVYAGGVLVGEGVVNSDESDGQLGDGLGLWEITVEPLADGVYQITTEVEDLAGNISPLSAALSIVIDTLSPQRPTIDLLGVDDTGSSDLDDVTNRANEVPLTITAEPGSRVVVKNGETVIDDFIMPAESTVRLYTLLDGEYKLSAEAFDAAGNRSAQSEVLSLVIDRTAPPATTPALAPYSDTGTPGDAVTSIRQPAFVGTAEANAKVRVYANGVLVGETFANSDESDGDATDGLGLWEVTVEPLADGVYQITTEVEDLAGNISAIGGPITVTIDTAGPQRPTIDLVDADDTGASDLDNVTIGDPGALPQTRVADFRISAEPGSTVVIKDGQVVIAEFVFNNTFDLTDGVVDGFGILRVDFAANQLLFGIPAEGPHPLSAEAFDGAGNFTQSEQLLVTIDATAPAATVPALADSSDSGTIGDGITSVTQPAFVGTAEANAKVRVFVRIAGGDNNNLIFVGETFANSDESDHDPTNGLGIWEITVEPLADGTYEVFTEVEDLAGNISPALESPLLITIDTIGPQRPTIDLVDSDDTGASDLDNVTVGDPDALPQTRVADFRISAEPDSTVVVKDGQIVIAEFVFDNDFDMTDGILDGFGILRIDFAANEAEFGIPAEGPHPLSAEAFDAAGNYTQSEQLLVTIDATPPAAPTITLLEGSDTLPLGDGITSNNEPAFQGTAEANSLVRLFANGELVGMAIAGSDESDGDPTNGLGVWEITTEPLKDDNYVFVATAEDLAGNVSQPSEDLPLTLAEFYGFFVDPVTGALIVHGEAGEADLFEISLDTSGTMVDVDWTSAGSGTVSISLPLATTPSITFYGYGGDDTLVVDNSNGLVTLPDGIYFHGAAGFDVIRLIGDTAIAASTYDVGPTVDAGRITHRAGESLQVVTFTGLEPVIDAVQAALLTVNATNADNAIAIADSLTPGFGRVTLDGFELIEFAGKAALQVNALGGNDTIDVRATSSLVPTTIDAGAPTASDRVIVNGTAGADAISVTPTGADSATVQVGAFSPITIVRAESLAINGLGGGDQLTVNLPATAGDRAIYEPGSTVDAGVVRVVAGAAGASLLPAEFANLGAAGSVVLHDGSGDGELRYIGTPLDDTLHVSNVAPAANQLAHSRYLPVVTEGFDTLRLNMLAGADSVIVAAEADYSTIEYGSGEPDTGDNVVLSNVLPTDYVVRHSAAGKTTVTAQATTHVLSGIESFAIIAGAAAGGDNLTVIGDSTVDDKLIVSPLAGTSIETGGPAEAASFRFDGSNLQFRFESLDGVFLYQGGESADLHLGDQLVVQASSSHDVVVVDAPNRTVSAENAAGTLLKTVTLDADVEVLTVETGLGNDTVLVIPAAQVGELAPGFGPNNLLINIDGGAPAASDALVIAGDASQPIPAALPGTDFVVVKHGLKAGEGVVRVFRNAVAMPDITYTNIEVVSPIVTPDPTTGDTPLLILGPDAYEQNEHRANAAYLGSGTVINVTDLAIFPGYGEHRFVVADEDYYRVVAQTTGVMDFQVFFRGFNATELPAGGNLDIYVLDADGTVIAGDGPLFGVNDGAGDFIDAAGRDNDERIRIPVVAGQTYYLHVTGAGGATSGIVNGYDLTIVNSAAPQPYALELDDTPPGDNTIGDVPANSDTGRSELDNVTRDNTPVIFFRLDDGILLHDLPGSATAGNPPDEVIAIPFNSARTAATTTPGFRVAIFDEGENGGQQVGATPQTPIGYARQVVRNGAVVEGVYVFDFDTDALDPAFTLSDGSHFLSARVQMIDPATPAQAGWGPRSALLEIVVDTTDPPVSFGFPNVAGDGLHQTGDTGIPNQPATYVDRITSDTTPTFWGIAEANAVIRVYADLNNNGVLDPATDLLLGKTVALPTDGTSQHPDGQWTLTSPINLNDPAYFPVLDRTRTLFVTAEDLAGNVSSPDSEDMLRIFLDTRGPQVSDIDILGDNYDLFDPKPSTSGPTPLVLGLDIDFTDQPLRNAQFVYPAVNPILATTPGNYILVGDANGIIPIKSIELIDTTVAGGLGRTTIRLHFFKALPDDRYTLTVSDRIADNAGNALDGESHAREPLETVLFPSGDGVPGGDFVARFTIDSRPEVATYAAGSVWVDTNGNGVFDPTNADRTNRDIVYTFGFTSDDLFVGNFAAGVEARADGFDKLAAYGKAGGQFRWLIDVNNDGVPDLNVPEPAQINGLPVAGRFDGNNQNGDEVGLYSAGTTNGSTWYFDTNHDFKVDTSLKSQLHGVPFVGDFDGDGYDDLATWQDDTFQFDLANGALRGWDGIVDASVTFRFGFIGVRERPVAADLDQDGYDDIGLWVPDRSGVAPIESSEWYILVSNGTTLFNRIVNDPDLGVPTIYFKPEPFGPDQFVQFGDAYAMPLLGNFDPPVAGTTASDPAVFEITGTGADDVFEFQASADGKIGSVILNGVVQTIPAGVTSIVFDGGGGYDTASLRGSSGDEVFIASPGSATLSGAGFSVTTRDTEVNHGYGMGGNDEATLYDTVGNDKFKAKPAEDYAKMYGGSYMNRAKFFSTVVGIFSEGNDDYARIWDSAADDVLTASPTEAHLVGESIDIRVLAANRLLAYSTAGGNDTANLYDSPGNDVMRARAHKTVFSGPGFDMTLRQWQTIHAFAENGGYDVAKLHDTSGNDVVLTAEDWGSLSADQPGGRRLLYDALGFDVVKAYHSKGNDKAPDPDVVDFLMLDGDWDTD
jgi:uncharacterized linocin/CFP29 family protein